MRIGIDLMGSEQAPLALFKAILQLSKENPSCHFVLFGKDLDFENTSQITLHNCDSVVEMEDSPLTVVRRKKDSTMAIGIDSLKEKKIDAFVSAGNTGALVAFAHFKLEMLTPMTSLALLVLLPTEQGMTAVLDVGANISFKPEHFLEWAKFGHLYFQIMYEKNNPTIGLLNIGVEEQKGTLPIKEGYRILSEYFEGTGLFLGNIEGKKVFQNGVDVLITDGFTGNIFLKTCEGVSTFLLDFFQKQSEESGFGKQLILSFDHQFNYSRGGALLCGVDGVVIKCHGDSTPQAFVSGVQSGIEMVQKEALKKIKQELRK